MRPVRTAVLISGSPRRRALLGTLIPNLRVIVPKIDEPPVVRRKDLLANAHLKFDSVPTPRSDLVLSADTAVFAGKTPLGKPASPSEAKIMLERLSGRWHDVLTAMVVSIGGKRCQSLVKTKVHFRKLDRSVIASYVATGEPLDKAGGYGIQGLGGLFVDRIVGDYYNVVGLPLPALELALEKEGYCLFLKQK